MFKKVLYAEGSLLLCCRATIGGYEPAGSFQIWYDATTQHFQEDHGLPPTKVLTEMLWVTPSPLCPPPPPPSPKKKINKKIKMRQKKQLNLFVNGK